MTPESIVRELRAARDDFHVLVDSASPAELRQRSAGTRWTNEQLLFHMLFGYLLVRNLLWLVRALARLPERWSRTFAAGLDAVTGPFHVVNYVGSCGGAAVLGRTRMERVMDGVIASLVRTLERSTEQQLARGMHFPVGWDPYFRDYMTVQDVLHYATEHYLHHRRQLTLGSARDQ
jgi:hypothetical protein